jgi:hypothetical protein
MVVLRVSPLRYSSSKLRAKNVLAFIWLVPARWGFGGFEKFAGEFLKPPNVKGLKPLAVLSYFTDVSVDSRHLKFSG